MKVKIRVVTSTFYKHPGFIPALGMALFLMACAPENIAEMRAIDPEVQALPKQLHLQYSTLSLRKSEEGNPDSARHFLVKAEQAAAGITVMPDRFPEKNKYIENAYHSLEQLLSSSTEIEPAVKARAQVMYDCWLEEVQQAVDPGDIAACKQAFDQAMLVSRQGAVPPGQVR